jgi:eukaryotic-like serine/threonine-protein kinase
LITAGQTIGNYRILSKIGTGGMGAVYLAEHPLIGKRVALKVIHRELAGNREVVSRFFQEARAVNTIGNEHIVEIHDFGVTPEGDHFYIMEYLDGRTLASVLAKETIVDVMRALHIGAQIAKALAAAHAAGVIHRDLKPDNIMLMSRLGDPDFVKVLDFGLAKMFADGASSVKTAYGVLLGTPQYMSPEACESKRDIDHRTDIYALGILLFQMMTGVLPFDGESMGEVLVKQVTNLPPAPRGLNPHIPPSVEQVLLRCLAKVPDARFQTMMELREALLDPETYLRASPPIAAARSVAPGEAKIDPRTVMMRPGAQAQRARTADPMGAPQRPKLGMGHGVPPGPRSGAQATIVAAGGIGPQRLPTGAIQVALPGLAPPVEPVNNTMRIATPLGYSSRPPRKMWPIVLVFGLLLGLGAGAFAVAWFDRGQSGGAGSATGGSGGSAPAAGSAVAAGSADPAGAAGAAGAVGAAGSAGSAGSARIEPGAGSAGAGSAAAGGNGSAGTAAGTGAGSGSAATAPPSAKLTIESVPPGASVFALDGAFLGKTPLKLEWPVSEVPRTFELRLPGYHRRTKELVVSGNTTVRIELERLPAPPPIRPPGTGSSRPPKGSNSDSGLMRPE